MVQSSSHLRQGSTGEIDIKEVVPEHLAEPRFLEHWRRAAREQAFIQLSQQIAAGQSFTADCQLEERWEAATELQPRSLSIVFRVRYRIEPEAALEPDEVDGNVPLLTPHPTPPRPVTPRGDTSARRRP